MTLRIPAALIAPDLRFALSPALASPGSIVELAGLRVQAHSSLPPELPVSRYLRYADRDAVIVAEGASSQDDLEGHLAAQLKAIAASAELDDLSTAVAALDAVDWCFRTSGLWQGNIYLAGAGSLTAVVNLVRGVQPTSRPAEAVVRELAALELAYLFPVASRFRAGIYDGRVQFRLNGWGRSLASRFSETPQGAARATAYKNVVSCHLAAELHRYRTFLQQFDFARQSYQGNLLDDALSLPIPVLI